jgi:hypothetical protein
MNLFRLCIAAIAALAFPLSAGAQTAGTSKPNFGPMTYFVGLWNCKHTKNPDAKLVGTTFSFAGATDPEGYWEVLDFQNGRINITRDSAANRWTFIYLGNGGDYDVMTTSGWSGNTLALKDVVTYGEAPLGEARFTKLSNASYRGTYTSRTANGTELFQTVCTRV